jgi:hypothetical protein
MRLSTFIDETVRALATTSPEACFERPGAASKADLFNGAAGGAFFFHEIARLRNDAEAADLAEQWCLYSEENFYDNDALSSRYPNRSRSVFQGKAGIGYVRILISTLLKRETETRRGVDIFKEAWDGTLGMGRDMPVELMFGAAGFVCAAHDLLQRCPRLPAALTDGLRQVEKQALGRVVEKLEQPLIDRRGERTAMAHGVASELFACLMGGGPRDLLNSRLVEFVDLAVDEPPLILWPARIAETGFGEWPDSWCNGIAGVLLLACRSVRVLQTNQYMNLAERIAFTTFRLNFRASIPTLCCGTAGQALALAAYADISGDECFRRRARERLHRAVRDSRNSASLRLEGLWTGRLGIALAALVTVSGEMFFPVLESPAARNRL